MPSVYPFFISVSLPLSPFLQRTPACLSKIVLSVRVVGVTDELVSICEGVRPALNVEIAVHSETLVLVCKTTWRHVCEDGNLATGVTCLGYDRVPVQNQNVQFNVLFPFRNRKLFDSRRAVHVGVIISSVTNWRRPSSLWQRIGVQKLKLLAASDMMRKKSGLRYTKATGRIPMDAADSSSRIVCYHPAVRPSLGCIRQPNSFCRRQMFLPAFVWTR